MQHYQRSQGYKQECEETRKSENVLLGFWNVLLFQLLVKKKMSVH